MKILLLAPRVPTIRPDGLSLVLQHILPVFRESCNLVLCGLEKTADSIPATGSEQRGESWAYFASTLPVPRRLHHLSRTPITLPCLYQGADDWVDAILTRERPEVAIVFGASMGSLIAMMSRQVPTVYVPLDAAARHHSMLAACTSGRVRLYQLFQAAKWRWYEPQVINYSSAAIYVSPMDAASVATRVRKGRLQVIPNGVDAAVFSRQASEVKEYAVAISGNFDYPPNVDGLLHFMNDILPRSCRLSAEARVLVLGKCSDPQVISRMAQIKSVTCVWNVDEMSTFIPRARVFACPVRFGTGIRNNVLQAMACGLPVITYPINVEALLPTGQSRCVIAESAGEFVDRMDRLLEKPDDELVNIGNCGRAYILAQHDWRDIGNRYLNVLLGVAKGHVGGQDSATKDEYRQ